MKILIVLLLIAGSASAQNLDTIYVRNLQLQAGDWLWLTGNYPHGRDSLTQKGFRKLRQVAQTLTPPVSMTTNVNVDSLPGRVVVEMYRIRKSSPGGEKTARYTAVVNAIAAKTVLTSFLAAIDAEIQAGEDRAVNYGKFLLLDN